MIVKCQQKQEEKVFSYIGENYSHCLYLYMNLKRYGVESDLIDVYFHVNDDEIKAVYLKYYSCIHVYSQDNDFSMEEFFSWSRNLSFSMIYCERKCAEHIWKNLSDEWKTKAAISNGWVAEIQNVDREAVTKVQKAIGQDFDSIVSLIYEDEDIGRSYNLEDLSCQLKERAESGYSRNYVIKDGDVVVAHACTNAELDAIAVVAELVVNQDYRRRGYASEIWRYLCRQLLNEGKEVFSFYYSEESRSLHKKIGFFEVCEWSKIVFSV